MNVASTSKRVTSPAPLFGTFQSRAISTAYASLVTG